MNDNASANANASHFHKPKASARNIKHAGAVKLFFSMPDKDIISAGPWYKHWSILFRLTLTISLFKHKHKKINLFHSLRLRLLDSSSHILELALHF